MTDPAIVGVARVGYTRVNVYKPHLFDMLLRQLNIEPEAGGTGGYEVPCCVFDQTQFDHCKFCS